MRRKNVELWMPKSPLEVLVDVQLQVKVSGGGGYSLTRVFQKATKMGFVIGQKIDYLTFTPQARMGCESIAHEAKGRMGY